MKHIPFITTAIQDKWSSGYSVENSWGIKHRELNYLRQEPFNDPIAIKEWCDAGHRYEKYTGVMLDHRDGIPSWALEIGNHFGLQNTGISLYKMTTGTILPTHRDRYVRYKKVYNLDLNDVMRVVVFLEDWQSGHYCEIDSVPVVNWHAGDCVAWINDVPHMAANIGDADRYTMQITGTI
jgi:hypothetical protein